MIITDPVLKELLLHNTINREIVIRFPDDDIADITNTHIVSESMILKRSIIKGKDLKFGGGIASQFNIKVIGIDSDLKGKKIEVSLIQTVRSLLFPSEDLFPSDNLFPCGGTEKYEFRLFTGKIDSALRLKNRAVKEIVAFDAFYNDSKYVYDFMTSFAAYSGNASLYSIREAIEHRLEYDTDEELFNDSTALSMTLENTKKAIKRNATTTTDILKAYAELNAAFAIMDRFNQLKYIQLLNPNVETISYYKDLEWEEYETGPITLLKFTYGGESDLYHSYGRSSDTPSIYISDNIITKCCSSVSELITAFYDSQGNDYIFNDIYKYRPYKAVLFDYWWLEPGDKVIIHTGAQDTPTVTSFVFSITLKGIRNLKATINADGKQYLGKDEMSNAV